MLRRPACDWFSYVGRKKYIGYAPAAKRSDNVHDLVPYSACKRVKEYKRESSTDLTMTAVFPSLAY